MKRVGEVIEASTTELVAQCYELYEQPPLGSLVKTSEGSNWVYYVVFSARTSSIDPGRQPIARGRDEADESSIFRSNPQLVKLLKSEFAAVTVGHSIGDGLFHRLPSGPPRVHSFVYLSEPEEVRKFCHSMEFLSTLLSFQGKAVDEVVAATVRELSTAQEDPHRFLVRAGKDLAQRLANDYGRLRSILARVGSV